MRSWGLTSGDRSGGVLDAGAHAYLPRRPVEQLARNVDGYLASQAHPELGTPAVLLARDGAYAALAA